MSRGTILGIGLLAFTLLAFLCIPRHLPVPSSSAPVSFTASLENGQLTLSGVLATEQAKAAALARAQELFKAGKVRLTDRLQVASESNAAAWETALPMLVAQLHAFQPQHASLTLEGRVLTVTGSVPSAEAKARVLRELNAAVGPGVKVQEHVTVATVPVSLPTTPTGVPSRAQMQAALDEALKGETVAFESNSAVLTARGRAVLDKLTPVLKRSPDAAIEIAGHTDPYGDPEYNLQLSHKRADAVRQYLVDHGSTNRFSVVGYGSSRPLINERTRAASQKNRRIEFRVKEER